MRAGLLACAALLAPTLAFGQTPGGDPNSAQPFGPPVNDQRLFVHGLLDQFEGRLGADRGFRWEGEGWVGGDFNRLWFKSEGEVTGGKVADGQQELFYDRPISSYFDLQVGGRYDLDSRAGRGWGAIGVEGFAPWYATTSATLYASGDGRFAAKLEGSDEIRFTQRLVLEPQAELNLYSRSDPARGVGAGASDLDAGLRLRYEITRKFAPYIGVTYEKLFDRTADFARTFGDRADDLRFTVGIRSWL